MKIITAENLIAWYDEKHKPCATVDLGETFIMETHDRIPVMSRTDTVTASFKDHFNPIYSVTGPVYINNTHPGDVLRIEIINIELTDKGIINATPGRAGFADKIQQACSKIVDIVDSEVIFSDTIKIPAHPHIGKIATTPAGGQVSTASPGPHGGNMDNIYLTTGNSVMLPVFLEGALLSVGDLHAAMGDGESNSSGVEATGRVTLRCHLVPNLKLKQPLVITDTEIQFMGEGRTLEEACRVALYNMADLVCDELKLSFDDAAMLISIAGNLHICQIANPLVGVRISMPKYLFSEAAWLC